MLDIRHHASERFVERVMGLDDVEMNRDQVHAVNVRIMQQLLPYMNQIERCGDGEYTVDGVVYVIRDMSLRTVKISIKVESLHNSEYYKKISGGRNRSGAKVKKFEYKKMKDK